MFVSRLAQSRPRAGTAAFEIYTLKGRVMLSGLALATGLLLAVTGPILQPADYHAFRDARTLFQIPNFWNVVTNLPLLVAGLWMLWWLRCAGCGLTGATRVAVMLMAAGVAATGVGSAYYHWSPDNATLVWDRLPIAITAAAFYAAVAADRISAAAGWRLLSAFLPLAVASVLWWAWSGDLRPYLFVQFFPVIALPIMLWWFEGRETRGAVILNALGLYAAAKVFEMADGAVFAIGQVTGGHALKHLLAAGAVVLVFSMFRRASPQTCSIRNLQ